MLQFCLTIYCKALSFILYFYSHILCTVVFHEAVNVERPQRVVLLLFYNEATGSPPCYAFTRKYSQRTHLLWCHIPSRVSLCEWVRAWKRIASTTLCGLLSRKTGFFGCGGLATWILQLIRKCKLISWSTHTFTQSLYYALKALTALLDGKSDFHRFKILPLMAIYICYEFRLHHVNL